MAKMLRRKLTSGSTRWTMVALTQRILASPLSPKGIPADGEKSPFWSSIGTDAVLSAPEAKYVTDTPFSEVLAVHVEYTDIGQKAFYFSDICYHRTGTGHMGICHKHNQMR